MVHLRLVRRVEPMPSPPEPDRAADWAIWVMIVCLAVAVGAFVTGVLDPGLRAG